MTTNPVDKIKRTPKIIVVSVIGILIIATLATLFVIFVLPKLQTSLKPLLQESNITISPTVLINNSVIQPSSNQIDTPSAYKLATVQFNGGLECKTKIFDQKVFDNQVYTEIFSVKESTTVGTESDVFLFEPTSKGCIAHFIFNFAEELYKLDLEAYKGGYAVLGNPVMNENGVSIYFAVRSGDNGTNFDLFSYNLINKQLIFVKDLNAAIFGDYKFSAYIYRFGLISVIGNDNILFEILPCSCGACDFEVGDNPTAEKLKEYNSCMDIAKRDSAKIEENLGVWSYNAQIDQLKKLFATK